MVTTLRVRNQATLPADVAAELGLKRGDRLEWTADPKHGCLIARIEPSRSRLLARVREIGRKTKRDGRDSADGLDRWRDEEDNKRFR